MGLFDDYFDPQQFEAGGGLLGRLLSLQQMQGQYQPGQGFGPPYGQPSEGDSAKVLQDAIPQNRSIQPAAQGVPPPASQPPDYGQTQNIPIGNYLMPQFGRAEPPPPVHGAPDFGDRLSAGFQSWARTPVGNPFAALANGITGFNSGQRTGQPTIPQEPLSQDQARLPAGPQNAGLAAVNPDAATRPPAPALARNPNRPHASINSHRRTGYGV